MMRSPHSSGRLFPGLAVAALAMALSLPAHAQPGSPAPSPGGTLTALDYLEIEQLVYRYAYALDTGADNGYAYADLYAEDATFTGTNQGPAGRTYRGRDQLAALARGGRRGPLFVSHYVANVVIEPAGDGAVGRTYVGILDIGNGGNGAKSRVDHGGLYNDVYVKTAAGWRFKSRTFYASTSGAPVQPPPAQVGAPRPLSSARASARATAATPAGALAAEDYIAIQQLVAQYPYALDQNPDNGATYAALFTPDAVFRQPRTEGRENLAKLATSAPHGPRYTRHFLANHVIEAAPGGAIGKQYLVVVDIGEAGGPSSIFLGGHYEDTYEKRAEGWRFKTRTFISSRTGDAPPAGGAAQGPGATLTPQDRADIQALTAGYARALGACAAEDYADLFAPEGGYFASNIRGEVAGRERLIAMVRSERHCTAPAATGAAAAPRPVPTVAIEPSAGGATGRADLGNAGAYEDEYVKTARGWRFKSRTVITPPERAAGLTARDMAAIRRLAGTGLGLFGDVYVTGADGVRRFRSSGVALSLSPDGVSGSAVLKDDGGRYDDVYVRTAQGGWRFKSRVYVAPADAAAPRAQAGRATGPAR